jgi:hypothetical protein
MARLLSLNGAALPKNLMLPQDDNPTGFWESQDVVDVSDKVLAYFDSEWDDIFNGLNQEPLGRLKGPLFAEALEAINANYHSEPLIVLKDPRVSVLAPFWKRVLGAAGYEPRSIIMVRDPLEVAASLKHRNAFSQEKALLIWANSMIATERDTRGEPRCFIRYDGLLADWRAVLNEVENRLQINLPRKTPTSSLECDRFIQASHRHHVASEEEKTVTKKLPMIAALYEEILKAAADEPINEKRIVDVEAELSTIQSIVGPVLAEQRLLLGEKRDRLLQSEGRERRLIDALADEKARYEELAAERESQSNADRLSLEASRDALYQSLAELTSQRDDAAALAQSLRDQIELDHTQNQRAREQEASARLGIQQKLERVEAERARLDSGLEEASGKLAQLQTELMGARTALDKAQGDFQAERQQLVSELARSGEMLVAAQAEFEKLRAAFAVLESTAAEKAHRADAEILTLRAAVKAAERDQLLLAEREAGAQAALQSAQDHAAGAQRRFELFESRAQRTQLALEVANTWARGELAKLKSALASRVDDVLAAQRENSVLKEQLRHEQELREAAELSLLDTISGFDLERGDLELSQQIAREHDEAEHHRRLNQAMLDARSQKDRALHLGQELEQAQAREDQLRERLDQLMEEQSGSTAKIVELNLEIESVAASRDSLRSALQSIEASTSWRATALVRRPLSAMPKAHALAQTAVRRLKLLRKGSSLQGSAQQPLPPD